MNNHKKPLRGKYEAEVDIFMRGVDARILLREIVAYWDSLDAVPGNADPTIVYANRLNARINKARAFLDAG